MREPFDGFNCGRARHGRGCCGRPQGVRRARKGWIRAAILALLGERSMHGYEMIAELSERTEGAWSPSPGAVYPALQLLVDEDLITSAADGSRRSYALTDSGRRALAAQEEGPAPWAAMIAASEPDDDAVRQAIAQLNAATAQTLAVGTAEQKVRARQVLVEARSALYQLLAEES